MENLKTLEKQTPEQLAELKKKIEDQPEQIEETKPEEIKEEKPELNILTDKDMWLPDRKP